jgi:choline-sulfatase
MGYSLRAVTTNPNGGIYKNGYGRWFDVVIADTVPLLAGCRDGLSRWLKEACAGADIGVVQPILVRLNILLDEVGWWQRGRHTDSRIGLAAADRLFRRDADGRPVAVWLHLTPPHDPFVAPAPYVGRFDGSPSMRSFRTSTVPYQFAFAERSEDHALFRARYDESIASITSEVAAFVRRLRAEGRLSNSILLISADHGESFTPDYGGHAGPRLHEPLIRIPLILAAPGLPSGRRIDAPVSQIDLAPTLIDLAGGTPPADMEGRSLLPLVAGEAPPIPVFAWALERSSRTVRPATGAGTMIDGRWKYVHYWNQPDRPGYRDLRDGLYDLATDPEESRDLAAAEPERAAAMRSEIQRRIAGYRPGGRPG